MFDALRRFPSPSAGLLTGKIISAALLLLCTGFAEDAPPAKSPGVQITFLPPPMEGALSLGIYNKEKKLVRTLHRGAEEKEFTVGLNGFITRWDGRDDAGNLAPWGKYLIRGYSVGELDVEGVAYHCNDWIVDEESPHVLKVESVLLQEPGSQAFTLKINLPSGASATIGSSSDGTLDPNSLAITEVTQQPRNPPAADKLPAEADGRAGVPPSALSQIRELAGSDARFVQGDGERCLVIGRNAGWLLAGEKWTRVAALPDRVIANGCMGNNGTLWLVEHGNDGNFVSQCAPGGERLRELAVAAADPQPIAVYAGTQGEVLALIEEAPGVQRTRLLSLKSVDADGPGSEPATSTWQTVLSKSIQISDSFAQFANKLDRPQPFKPEGKIAVKLQPNPLFKDKQTTVDLQVAVDEKGSYFRTPDGLPLCRIAETPHLKWAVMGREGKDKAITILQSDGAVVEEFRVKKPANMMAFEAGEYEWGPEAAK